MVAKLWDAAARYCVAVIGCFVGGLLLVVRSPACSWQTHVGAAMMWLAGATAAIVAAVIGTVTVVATPPSPHGGRRHNNPYGVVAAAASA